MIVKTHSLTSWGAQDRESEAARCACGRKATYWTQADDGKHHPLSGVIYHCQTHRNAARKAVIPIAQAAEFSIKAILGN